MYNLKYTVFQISFRTGNRGGRRITETQQIFGLVTNYLLNLLIISLPPAYVVRREGNSFTLFVCPHLGGEVPISHNALQHFPECHGAVGGVPCEVQPGGYPGWGGTQSGNPPQVRMGGYPGRGGTLAGGVPWSGTPLGGYLTGYPPGGVPWPGGTLVRYPPRPGQDGGVPCWGGYPGRTTEGVLTTRRAVCLLHAGGLSCSLQKLSAS